MSLVCLLSTRADAVLAYKYTPTLEAYLKTPSGQPGWLCSFYNHDEDGNPIGESVQDFVLQDTRVKLNDFLPTGLTPTWTIKLRGSLTMDKTAEYQLGLTVAGRAKLFVNGELTIDNWTKQRPGDFFYGSVCYLAWHPIVVAQPSLQTRHRGRDGHHFAHGWQARRHSR